MEIEFLENATNPYAVMQSKGIGEPPFLYAIGVYFALMNAIKACKPGLEAFYQSPLTPERVLTCLWKK
jgi:xanthine dehydrogenase large subunit